MWTFSLRFLYSMLCIKTRIEWLKRIIAALTGTCIFGDAVTFINKDCRVLFGDIFIVPFLGPALGWTAMCMPGWGNLVAIDWNDGREFDSKFLKIVKSPNPHPIPCLPPPARQLNIDRCISLICRIWFLVILLDMKRMLKGISMKSLIKKAVTGFWSTGNRKTLKI